LDEEYHRHEEIIICKTKDSTVAKYALKNTAYPIAVAIYTITANLSNDYVGLVFSPEGIRDKLQGLKEMY